MPLPDGIRSTLERGGAVITANARAARWVRREYALNQRALGRTAWGTPAIEDWDSWLRGLWMDHALRVADAPLLLTSLQERSLWTRVERDDAKLLVSPSGVAALAESAYRLLGSHDARGERRHEWGKVDAERFRAWAAAFEHECSRQNWVSRSGLEQRVAGVLEALALPKELLLVGFDRLTPAQEAMRQALAECDVAVRVMEPAVSTAQVEYRRASGPREELRACAEWARDRLEANPETRIGVLVPDLDAVRAEAERAFRRVLDSRSDDIFEPYAPPFEFSLGQPLAQAPAIRTALLLLRWLNEPLEEEEATWLLLSGFVGGADEYLQLAQADAKRRSGSFVSPEVSLESILSAGNVQLSPALRGLAAALASAQQDRLSGVKQSPGWWVERAQSLLRAAGWPGVAEIGTLTFQAVGRWGRALDELALLDFDGSLMDFGGFLHTLESHASETIFAPESKGAPVQIMGALEASGQQFDALWFLGVDDTSWPLRGRPHPLLPNDVQRRYRMPYADPENDLELAQAVTARIAASAPLVVFSYSERNKDGELRPSPLLPRDAVWRAVEDSQPPHSEPQLEMVEESAEVVPWPFDQSPGGSETLKKQAACPFQAFAAKRLHAESLNRAEWGLTAAERGSLLHETLRNVWSPDEGALHTLGDLKAAIAEGRIQMILEDAIERAFADCKDAGDAWMRAYLDTEKLRLRARLAEWMEIEARRQPFQVIACEEKLPEVDVGGLKLHLRVDRVDQLPDVGRLLIDYKTGVVSARMWEGSRPDEPQLPLYAVFGGLVGLEGALFAQIRAGETGFIGSVADANGQLFEDLGKRSALVKNPYTPEMRDAWGQALVALAEEFLRGKATVDPKRGDATCKVCSFAALCRVAETRDIADDEGDPEEGDDDDESAS